MARLSPFGLLRVAAYPIARLHAFQPPETTRAIDAAVATRARMRELRAPLEQALHAIAPSLEPRLRRGALELKRAVHNSRPPCLAADQCDAIVKALPATGRGHLSEWLHQQRSFTERLAEAEMRYADEIRGHVRAALRAFAADEAFLRPLALASPSLLSQVTRKAELPAAGPGATRLERSLMLYAARAAAKCSPFSVFMHQALVQIANEAGPPPRLDPDDRDSRVYLNRTLLFKLYSESFVADGRFMLNPSIVWRPGGAVEALVPDYFTFSTRLLRLGRWTNFRLHPFLTEQLASLPATFSLDELWQALVAMGLAPAKADGFATRLRERGLVLPEPFCTGFDADPESNVIARLDGTAHPALRATLIGLSESAKALPHAPSRRRGGILADARTRVDDAWRILGRTPDARVASVFWEDGFFRRPAAPTGEGIHGLLLELASALRPHAVMAAPYRALRDYFIAQHGEGGVCRDLLAFLSQASAALTRTGWWLADPAESESPARADARIAVSILVQFSASSEAALAAGDALIVANHVYPGLGWLSARHGFGASEYHCSLRDRLAKWLASCHAPAEPLDIMLSGDCNSLQAHPRLTRLVLHWPIEPVADGGDDVIPASAVSLRHDRHSELLELVGPAGVRLAPVYLGTTVPQPTWGAEFWLATLAMPHRVGRPTAELLPPSGVDVEVLPLPRRGSGRVVLSRAAWWISAARLRRVWFRREGVARLLDVATDREELHIPRRVFIRAALPTRPGFNDDHKPLWIDTANPFSLEVLFPLLSRTNWLLLTEALPDLPVWPILSDQPHVSELLVEMVL